MTETATAKANNTIRMTAILLLSSVLLSDRMVHHLLYFASDPKHTGARLWPESWDFIHSRFHFPVSWWVPRIGSKGIAVAEPGGALRCPVENEES
jgi:hypothetical protein